MVEKQELAIQKIRDSLHSVEGHSRQLRKTNSRLLVFSVVSSAATTLIAGVTAAQGPVIGTGVPGWRLSCALAAAFGFATTVCVGLNQELRIADRLAKANQMLGRLRFLDIAIDTGSRDWAEITREYEDIVKAFPEVLI